MISNVLFEHDLIPFWFAPNHKPLTPSPSRSQLQLERQFGEVQLSKNPSPFPHVKNLDACLGAISSSYCRLHQEREHFHVVPSCMKTIRTAEYLSTVSFSFPYRMAPRRELLTQLWHPKHPRSSPPSHLPQSPETTR